MKKTNFIIGLIICLGLTTMFFSCNDKEKCECKCDSDQKVIICKTEYENAPNDSFGIDEMTIIGDCLTINFNSGGCNGSTWVVKLIDQGGIAKSDPPQRTLRLSLENKEDCLAMVYKEISFDIKCLQVPNCNKVSLNVSGNWILYEY